MVSCCRVSPCIDSLWGFPLHGALKFPDRDSQMAQSRSPKSRALGYLSRREYSRAELSRKLMPYVEEVEALRQLLDGLERDGWLSDARFADSVVHRRVDRFGTDRITDELRRHGVDGDLIGRIAASLRGSEAQRARAVWEKKFGVLPSTLTERAKQARFLVARGFSRHAIAELFRGDVNALFGEEDDDSS